MAKSTAKDARDLFRSLYSAYGATPSNLKIIDVYIVFAVLTALIQVIYMAIVGSFPFNSFLSGVLSCTGTAVLAVCLRIQVNKENKEFKDLPPERAFADFVLCNLVLHLVIMNFLGMLVLCLFGLGMFYEHDRGFKNQDIASPHQIWEVVSTFCISFLSLYQNHSTFVAFQYGLFFLTSRWGKRSH